MAYSYVTGFHLSYLRRYWLGILFKYLILNVFYISFFVFDLQFYDPFAFE